jgi:hypothetical protein
VPVQREIACPLAAVRAADHERDKVRLVVEDARARRAERVLGGRGVTSRRSWEPFGRRTDGETSCVAVEVDEDPISSLVPQALNHGAKMRSCGLVERRPRALRAVAYSDVLTHDPVLPGRQRRRQGRIRRCTR